MEPMGLVELIDGIAVDWTAVIVPFIPHTNGTELCDTTTSHSLATGYVHMPHLFRCP